MNIKTNLSFSIFCLCIFQIFLGTCAAQARPSEEIRSEVTPISTISNIAPRSIGSPIPIPLDAAPNSTIPPAPQFTMLPSSGNSNGEEVHIMGNTTEKAIILTPSPTPAWQKDLASLEYELADSGYKVNPTAINKSKLLFVAEKLINNHCIPGVSLDYSAKEKNPDSSCDQLTRKILSLDPTNPAAICSRMGIDSIDCDRAYARMGINTLYADSSNDKDLDIIIGQSINTNNITNIQNNISIMSQEYSTNQNPETLKKLMELFSESISTNCKIVRYDVPQIKIKPTISPSNNKNQKPFQNMLDELTRKATPNEDTETKTRFRLLLPNCMSLLTQLMEVAPTSALYICQTQGAFSPRCLKAIKGEKNKGLKNLSAATNDDELGSF